MDMLDTVKNLVRWGFFTALIGFIAKIIWGIIPPHRTEFFYNRKRQNKVIKAKHEISADKEIENLRKYGINEIEKYVLAEATTQETLIKKVYLSHSLVKKVQVSNIDKWVLSLKNDALFLELINSENISDENKEKLIKDIFLYFNLIMKICIEKGVMHGKLSKNCVYHFPQLIGKSIKLLRKDLNIFNFTQEENKMFLDYVNEAIIIFLDCQKLEQRIETIETV